MMKAGQLVAHSLALHVATDGGYAERAEYLHQQYTQPIARLWECQGGCQLLPPVGVAPVSHHTVLRDHPVVAHGRRNDASAAQFLVMRCPPGCPLFASWPWLRHTGGSLEVIDRTVHERNR